MQYESLEPVLTNPFEADHFLKTYIQSAFPQDMQKYILEDLHRFGERIVNEIEGVGKQAEAQPPYLKKYSAWGRRINEIVLDPSWSRLDEISAEEGLVAIAYERKWGRYSRPYQFAKMYLFHPSSAYYSCPLAMTDGAAKLIEAHGDSWLQANAFQSLTSRDPHRFWTSGQWMTEKNGGSDVGQSETVAEEADGHWQISGTKWFTSATSSQMTMLLARTEKDGNGKWVEGSKGLSLFFAKIREDDLLSPHLNVLRLKDKLGTKALPTAELELDKLPGRLVGLRGQGVKTMATLFNISRINNTCASVSTSARVLQLLQDYSKKRKAFGKHLIDHPLHRENLLRLNFDFHLCFALGFLASELLGKAEVDKSGDAEALLRLLTPIAKLYTAKTNLRIVSECLEGFGGAGYMEDVGIAKFLRDSQVLCIWEGTTNVLCLDMLRALHKDQPLPVFLEWCTSIQKLVLPKSLESLKAPLQDYTRKLSHLVESLASETVEMQEAVSRDLAFSIAEVWACHWLMEFSHRSGNDPQILSSAEYNIRRRLKKPLLSFDSTQEITFS